MTDLAIGHHVLRSDLRAIPRSMLVYAGVGIVGAFGITAAEVLTRLPPPTPPRPPIESQLPSYYRYQSPPIFLPVLPAKEPAPKVAPAADLVAKGKSSNWYELADINDANVFVGCNASPDPLMVAACIQLGAGALPVRYPSQSGPLFSAMPFSSFAYTVQFGDAYKFGTSKDQFKSAVAAMKKDVLTIDVTATNEIPIKTVSGVSAFVRDPGPNGVVKGATRFGAELGKAFRW